jgi:hypothetical protein
MKAPYRDVPLGWWAASYREGWRRADKNYGEKKKQFNRKARL